MRNTKIFSVVRMKVLALSLSLALIAALFTGIGVTVSAMNHTVDISPPTGNVGEIQLAIDNADTGDTITVTGSKTDVVAALELTIPADKKVIWKANYTGSNYLLLELSGKGIFEVAAGGTISTSGDAAVICNYSDEEVTIVVSGGTISISGDNGKAIEAKKGNVTVTSGIVSATGNGGTAISTTTGNVEVSGGTVEATGQYSCSINTKSGNVIVSNGIVEGAGNAVNTESGNVTISGGTLEATGKDGIAIYNQNGDVIITNGSIKANNEDSGAINVSTGNITVSGGAVEANGIGGTALNAYTNGIIKISGGTVKATAAGRFAIAIGDSGAAVYLDGTITAGGFNINKGLVVEIDRFIIPKDRNNTSTGITKIAGDGTFFWDCSFASAPHIEFGLAETTLSVAWGEYAHKHTPGTDWQKDATGHWKTCGGCTDKLEFAAHTPGDWIVTLQATETEEGIREKRCTVCGYITETEIIPTLPATGEIGDINGDGKVNAMDFLLLKQHILEIPGKNLEPGTKAFRMADFNVDGKINGMDLLLLKKKILG